MPLSAAEKRNAFGGPLPVAIRRVSRHRFFDVSLPYSNKRYRHYDLAAKMLIVEAVNGVTDTKKIYLDNFVRSWKGKGQNATGSLVDRTMEVLDDLTLVFTTADSLLRSVGMTMLYYHISRLARRKSWLEEITRYKYLQFEKARLENRKVAEKDISKANYDLLEFDRYVQTPNDAYATNIRLGVLLDHVFNRRLAEEPKPPHAVDVA